jgi:hypothetical protein
VEEAKVAGTTLTVSEAHNEAMAGVGAQTLLNVLEPLMERRIKSLLDSLAILPPDLPILLDVRAKLVETRRIQRELERVKRDGVEAAEALRTIMTDK